MIEKCTFEVDKWGFYLLPILGYSNTPTQGPRIWFGWWRWLWTIHLKAKP